MALISEPSITKAIEKSGIAKKTAYKYLKDKNFFSEYQKLRQEMIGRTTSLLLQASGRAVEVLYEVADDPEKSPYARVQAAKTILEMAYRGMELEDLQTRIERLERGMELWKLEFEKEINDFMATIQVVDVKYSEATNNTEAITGVMVLYK